MLARQTHPDRFAGRSERERRAAERRMGDLNAAWAVLRDPERRRAYDRRLAADEPRPAARPAPPPYRPPSGPPPRRRPPGMEPPAAVSDPSGCLKAFPIVVVGVLVLIFVFTALVSGSSDDGGVPDTPVPLVIADLVGRCVRVQPGLEPTPTACVGSDGLVVSVVGNPSLCRSTEEPLRFPRTAWHLCLAPPP